MDTNLLHVCSKINDSMNILGHHHLSSMEKASLSIVVDVFSCHHKLSWDITTHKMNVQTHHKFLNAHQTTDTSQEILENIGFSSHHIRQKPVKCSTSPAIIPGTLVTHPGIFKTTVKTVLVWWLLFGIAAYVHKT